MTNSEVEEHKPEGRTEHRGDEHQERDSARRAAELRSSREHHSEQTPQTKDGGELSHLHPPDSIDSIRRDAALRAEARRMAEGGVGAEGKHLAVGSDRPTTSAQMERAAGRPDEVARLRAEKSAERESLLAEEYVRKQEAHEANYHKLTEKAVRGEVEFGEPSKTYVRVEDILEPERAGERAKMESPEFWNHHGNSYEFYDQMAEKYPKLRERLARGESLDAIKSDDELRVAADFWYSEGQPVKLEKYEGSHFVAGGYHRYALARKFRLGDVPASVHEARDKR